MSLAIVELRVIQRERAGRQEAGPGGIMHYVDGPVDYQMQYRLEGTARWNVIPCHIEQWPETGRPEFTDWIDK